MKSTTNCKSFNSKKKENFISLAEKNYEKFRNDLDKKVHHLESKCRTLDSSLMKALVLKSSFSSLTSHGLYSSTKDIVKLRGSIGEFYDYLTAFYTLMLQAQHLRHGQILLENQKVLLPVRVYPLDNGFRKQTYSHEGPSFMNDVRVASKIFYPQKFQDEINSSTWHTTCVSVNGLKNLCRELVSLYGNKMNDCEDKREKVVPSF